MAYEMPLGGGIHRISLGLQLQPHQRRKHRGNLGRGQHRDVLREMGKGRFTRP